jgi:hypothetical protein
MLKCTFKVPACFFENLKDWGQLKGNWEPQFSFEVADNQSSTSYEK